MSARDHDRQEGRLKVGVRKIRGRHVAVNVIDRHQRNAVGKGQRFGKVDPHEERADQPWIGRDRHRTKVAERDPRLPERLVDDARHRLDVRTAGDLGNHAAVKPMDLDLRGHDIGANRPYAIPHLHHGRRGLVAGAFHS